MKMETMLSMLFAVAIFMFALANQSDNGNMLATELNMLANANGGNSYQWNTPGEIQVSNEFFRVTRLLKDEDVYMFCLFATNKGVVATCVVGETHSTMEARRRLCSHLVAGVTMPMASYISHFRGEVGSNDCFRIVRHASISDANGEDVSRHSAAYGNLYVDVQVRTNKTSVTARSFVNSLVGIGVNPIR